MFAANPATPDPARAAAIQVRALRADELSWANARYAEIEFRPSSIEDFLAIAEVAGQRAGLGRVVPLGGGAGELGGMRVLPGWQGVGLARRLVAWLQAHCGMRELYCLPFAELEGFYRGMGFGDVPPGLALPDAVREKHAWCNAFYPQPVALLYQRLKG